MPPIVNESVVVIDFSEKVIVLYAEGFFIEGFVVGQDLQDYMGSGPRFFVEVRKYNNNKGHCYSVSYKNIVKTTITLELL